MKKSLTLLLVLLSSFLTTTPARTEGFDIAIEKSLPAVIKLYGIGAGMEKGFGSGVLVSPDGMVLTVFSLLIDARTIRAVDAEGTTYEADVLYRDRQRQLAMLKLKPRASLDIMQGWDHPSDENDPQAQATMKPFPYIDISCDLKTQSGPSCGVELMPGDWVLSVGNAFKVADGAEKVSIAHGVFSARTHLDARRRVKDFPYTGDVLVIDAITSNPGAPGSALVNLDGEFIGLIGREVISNQTHTHLNYALPRDVLYEFYIEAKAFQPGSDASLAHARKPKPQPKIDIGIRISKAGYQTVLPFVERVKFGSLAGKAGVRKDDLILSINNRNVASIDDYNKRLRSATPGESINLVIRRGRRILNIVVKPEATDHDE